MPLLWSGGGFRRHSSLDAGAAPACGARMMKPHGSGDNSCGERGLGRGQSTGWYQTPSRPHPHFLLRMVFLEPRQSPPLSMQKESQSRRPRAADCSLSFPSAGQMDIGHFHGCALYFPFGHTKKPLSACSSSTARSPPCNSLPQHLCSERGLQGLCLRKIISQQPIPPLNVLLLCWCIPPALEGSFMCKAPDLIRRLPISTLPKD